MSQQESLCGYIEEFGFGDEERAFNDAALAALPETDSVYPPMVRSMFAAPLDPRAGFRSKRAIGFAITHNYLCTSDFHLWLPKFEAVLRTLRWRYAIVHLDRCLFGKHTLEYDLDLDVAERMRQDHSMPGTAWELRCFRLDTYQSVPPLDWEVNDRSGFTETIPYWTLPPRKGVKNRDLELLRTMLNAIDLAHQMTANQTLVGMQADQVLFRALRDVALEVSICFVHLSQFTQRCFPADQRPLNAHALFLETTLQKFFDSDTRNKELLSYVQSDLTRLRPSILSAVNTLATLDPEALNTHAALPPSRPPGAAK